MPTYTLADLAARLGAEVAGEAAAGALEVRGIRALADAGPHDLAFVHQASYLKAARESQGAALLLPRALAPAAASLGRPLLLVDHSQLAVAQAIALLHPPRPFAPGVHATAIVGEGCEIDPSVHIGPYAVLGEGCRLGAGVVIEAHAVLGRGCQLAEGVRIHPQVVLYDGTEIGARSEVHSGTVLGADGFGYATVAGVHHKVPQVGRVVLGADVEVGALTAIDRATLEATRVGDGTKIDNQVQVGHNVEIGKGCIVCGQVGIAGSTRLGNYVVMAGGSGASGHLEIGDQVTVAACSVLFQDSPPKRVVAGVPAVDIQEWRRTVSAQPRLSELLRRVRRLEKALEKAAGAPSPADAT